MYSPSTATTLELRGECCADGGKHHEDEDEGEDEEEDEGQEGEG